MRPAYLPALMMGSMVAKIEGPEAGEFLCAHQAQNLNVWQHQPALPALCVRRGASATGVAQLRVDAEELTIVHWASQDGSEWSLMNAVVAEASARGCTRVRAEFVANGSNEGMREFPAQFGFTMIGEEDNATLWILPVSAYEPSSW